MATPKGFGELLIPDVVERSKPGCWMLLQSELRLGSYYSHAYDRRPSLGHYAKGLGLVLSGYLIACLEAPSPSFKAVKQHGASRPIGDIQWYPCPDIDDPKIECGTIVVPLDYFDPNVGTATIALGKYKADPAIRRGSIFLNPGGPGGPGVRLATQAGPLLVATRLGPYYDLIGFDPRGMPIFEKPKTSTHTQDRYWADNDGTYTAAVVFELGHAQPPNTTVSSSSSDALISRQRAFDDIVAQQRQALALFETQAKLCTKNIPNGGAALNYMGTASVVRDIAFMTDILDGKGSNMWVCSLISGMAERMGKGMIEAIANPAEWADKHSHEWMDTWIQDADEAYRWFLNSCAKVGEASCALAKGNISADAIEQKVEKFIDELYASPMPSINSIVPAYLTAGTVRSKLFDAMEAPPRWPAFARDLEDAIKGNPAPLLNKVLPDPARDRFDHGNMARYAVTCIDSLPFNKSDPSTFPTPEYLAQRVVQRVNSTSKYFGGSTGLTDIDGGCQFWPVDGIERYAGPWNRTLANPVMVISSSRCVNETDRCLKYFFRITPLASAKFINNQLGDMSRLVIVNAPGHGVPFPSLCQFKASLAYFNNGTLPEDETRCEMVYGPFEDPEGQRPPHVIVDRPTTIMATLSDDTLRKTAAKERDRRVIQLTAKEISEIPAQSGAQFYRGVGKMFMQEPRSTIENSLKSQEKELTNDINNLAKKLKYHEKQLNDSQAQMRDIVCISQ
ncbi:prefoldin subunit domain-containing protein [Rhizoctonia solani AG-1 IA]|uniref:Prefoldin subunit domain-containing protein n=1 Tax=Thanatephorus cucumeris (strain AG1-IA) TaxID=983506 RepID=L8WRM1_THACA|nr:prefoldin subunit domain-containing protein [Rhizoctonia solani AG-1 IA]